MKAYWTVALCVLAVPLIALGHGGQEPKAEQVPPCVVAITARDQAGNTLRRGFGLFVSDTGDVMTPADLIEGAGRVEVETVEGKRYTLIRLIAKDIDGMVLFEVSMQKGEAKAVKVSHALPGVGSLVGAVSENEQLEPCMVTGPVTSRMHFSTWESLEVAAALPSRSIGNPVFNKDGGLVGTITLQSDRGPTFTVRAPERLSTMLDELLAARGTGSAEKAPVATLRRDHYRRKASRKLEEYFKARRSAGPSPHTLGAPRNIILPAP